MKVVCIQEEWHYKDGRRSENPPVVGEIYTPMFTVHDHDGQHYYKLRGFDGYWNIHGFRDTDDSFGPVVCETIEKQLEYEEALESICILVNN